MKSLENQVNSAKRAGTYDVGIRTLAGNTIEFADKPRTFSFRGLGAKDDRVFLYKVVQDRGTSTETAMELYNDAKDDASIPASRNEWNRRGQRLQIVSGFYTDSRGFLKVTPKVFLIINPGAHSDQCITIRPNVGRRTVSKYDVRKKLMEGNLASVGAGQAMKIWKREFELSDIPFDEKYQFSCNGRHMVSYIFAGSIVPILNKMLITLGSMTSHNSYEKRPFRVVRVETSNSSSNMNDAGKEAPQDESSDSDDEVEETDKTEMVVVNPVLGGREDTGKGVARKSDKIGACVFRGNITKVMKSDMSQHLLMHYLFQLVWNRVVELHAHCQLMVRFLSSSHG
mmetsp:Transcript_6956/g.13000  ORF Transcript_6956/g.13000 Transcript_6956/m.13000 type:complete len:341 (-) Transcript_6956:736-1758(-)